MTYSLQFSERFFEHGEEIAGENRREAIEKPTSVLEALINMKEEDWLAVCQEIFPNRDPDMVDYDDVMGHIQKIDTCSSLSSPIEVWIDENGYHTIFIY